MDIRTVQQALVAAGFPLVKFGADGHWGDESRIAMQAFQKSRNLPVTDRPDEVTARALGKKIGEVTGDLIAAPSFKGFNQPKAERPITEIIIHCTATPEGRDVPVSTIRKWHMDKGWSDIGYHWVVGLDGTLHPGRPEAKIGSHVAGHNTGTLGVSYVGGVTKDGKTPKDTRTSAQRTALISLVRALRLRYPTITKVTGHNQYSSKACPSFDVRQDALGHLI